MSFALLSFSRFDKAPPSLFPLSPGDPWDTHVCCFPHTQNGDLSLKIQWATLGKVRVTLLNPTSSVWHSQVSIVFFPIQSPALISFDRLSRCARERSRVQLRYISTDDSNTGKQYSASVSSQSVKYPQPWKPSDMRRAVQNVPLSSVHVNNVTVEQMGFLNGLCTVPCAPPEWLAPRSLGAFKTEEAKNSAFGNSLAYTLGLSKRLTASGRQQHSEGKVHTTMG